MVTNNNAKGDVIYGENVIINKGENPKFDRDCNQDKGQEMQYINNTVTNKSNKVFIIHGHNEAKWRELDSILHGMDLHTIVLTQQPDDGKTIIEKFEHYATQCSFAFALFTYDDIIVQNGESLLQVRPNVIFELGWFYARIGRENVHILEQLTPNSSILSDLQGVIRTQYHENVEEVYVKIRDQLLRSGIIKKISRQYE